jgi:hypothetical protein
MNIVEKPISTDELIKFFIENLKKIITNINSTKNVFFSDFKAGDLHWTVDEILNGQKNNLTLIEACKLKGVIKLDIIAPYDERYLEMSTFFILQSQSELINVDQNYFANFTNSLIEDIEKYKVTKPFKAIKRIWSLSRINNDIDTLVKLEFLVRSNIALFAQINADIETVELLIKHKDPYDKNFLIIQFNEIKSKISNVQDIVFDEQKIDIFIALIINLIKSNDNEETSLEIIKYLGLLHDYFLDIINKSTIEYLESIKYTFPNFNLEKNEEKINV